MAAAGPHLAHLGAVDGARVCHYGPTRTVTQTAGIHWWECARPAHEGGARAGLLRPGTGALYGAGTGVAMAGHRSGRLRVVGVAAA